MIDDYYSATYSDARANFLSACLDAGLRVKSYRNPEKGPQGEALFMDVTWIGPESASRAVVVTSATHGAEGFAGSGIQVGLLRDGGAPRPGDETAVLIIHAVNPYGFAWIRRVNEDNVDLNRNFVDHECGNYPENDLFEELAAHMIPRNWDEESIAACQAAIAAVEKVHGEVAVRKAIGKGQYHHPDNVHYGGDKATWSNRMLAWICGEYLKHAEQAVLIDVHSGLGPYGYGELMTPSVPGEKVYDLFFDWYGEQVHSTMAGGSAYSGSKGSILAGFRPPVEGLDWASVGLEYGTREREGVRLAVRADTWLHAHGDLDSDLGRRIKRDLKDSFYPEETEWKEKVWERGKEVIGIALERIGEG
jgi:hypothetical protein